MSGTLSRWLRRILALELALYLVVGAWLAEAHGWTASGAAGLAIACAVIWRAAFGLTAYAVAWRWRSATPQAFRVGPVTMALHVAAELCALNAAYSVFQPFERLWMGASRPPAGSRRRLPVLLVHGYVCNRGVWWPLARSLRARGESCWGPDFEPVYGAIDAWVPQLAARIDALLAATGAARVVLVTHSMGGLAARAYLRRHGGGKVARLVTLGAPHHGSMHAHLGAGENARAMEPGSAWLAGLAAGESAGLAAPLVCIYSHHDDFVAPQTSSAHPSGRNVPLAGTGHIALLWSRTARDLVLRELDAANAAG
jgi:triacylglycerol esterase/lipase EstA (alpha/beta hydrolase family)